jgi:hypothetical protein|nr:MAG TPA: hypothetical protein [Caudoviricetes sp.]
MEITKINGEEIKIGKTSITVKGDNSKTIGVIRSCTIINNSLAPRILFEISRKFKEKNINLMSLYNRLVVVDENYYFLYNLRKNDFVEKYAIKNPEIFQADINKVKEQDELADLCIKSGIIQIVKCRY